VNPNLALLLVRIPVPLKGNTVGMETPLVDITDKIPAEYIVIKCFIRSLITFYLSPALKL
jgi:hypothetical protein